MGKRGLCVLLVPIRSVIYGPGEREERESCCSRLEIRRIRTQKTGKEFLSLPNQALRAEKNQSLLGSFGESFSFLRERG